MTTTWPGATTASQNPDSRVRRIGVWATMAYLFLVFSRVIELLPAQLRLALATAAVASLAALLTGGFRRALSTGAGRMLTAFSVWLVLSTPWSFWRGGSLALLRDQWLKCFLCFVMVGGLLEGYRECRQAAYGIAAGTVTNAVLCLRSADSLFAGRLSSQGGMSGNPNDLAQLLLLGLPFLFFIAFTEKRRPVRRLAATAAAALVLLVVVATGSRGNMVAIAAVAAVVFCQVRLSQKLAALAAAVALVAALAALLPEGLRQRYLSVFDKGIRVQQQDQFADSGSIDGRYEVLLESLRMTWEHPLLGVGPGVFPAAAAKQSEKRGERPMWRETHNTYTQISSEAGLPALCFYLAALTWCLRRCWKIHRFGRRLLPSPEIPNLAHCVMLSLIVLATTSLFSCVAYMWFLPVLAGLTVAILRCAEAEASQAAGSELVQAAPQPGAFPDPGLHPLAG